MKKISLLILFMSFLIMLNACVDQAAVLEEKVVSVPTETDINFMAYSRSGISIYEDHIQTTYLYRELASDIIGKIEYEVPYNFIYTNDYVYYLFSYKVTRDNIGSDYVNYNKLYSVALFQTNLYTGETLLIHDFENTFLVVEDYPTILQVQIHDDQYLSCLYNGSLLIIDFIHDKTIDSIHFYDREDAVNGDSFIFNQAKGIYYLYDHMKVDVYIFTEQGFIKRTYYILESTYLEVHGDMLYIFYYVNKETYITDFKAYDLITNDEISHSDAEMIIENITTSSLDYYEFIYQGSIYHFDQDYSFPYDFTVFDENDQTFFSFNVNDMINSSQAYVDLSNLMIDSEGQIITEIISIEVQNDRIFVLCRSNFGWLDYTPTYVFEYQIDTQSFLYGGYISIGTNNSYEFFTILE